ncbi:fucolectin-6-like, partial [Rhinatrema bivittatum]|uniref:fucolectin-6-like n=1 Tax=Rhinatrema bivittatum TaxID=194408 RepID=UPI001127EB49
MDQAHTYCDPQPHEKNIAPSGVASQSSLHNNKGPELAIDGNANSHYERGSCSHTGLDAVTWWRLDLLRNWKIRSVVLVNRGDCCPERLLGASVRIGNSPYNTNPVCCTITESDIQAGSIIRLCCHGMEGRYVSVVLPQQKGWLSLCEVEVYPDLPYQSQ